jgi:preprotein translocase subunit SecG
MLELLETPLTVLHILVCFFLVLVVLIQPGKSGGLGAAFGGAGATQVFGGRGAGNFLSRTTWICAALFFVTSMTLAYISSSTDDSLSRRAKEPEVHAVKLPGADKAPEAAGAAAPDTPAEPAPVEEPAGEAPSAESAPESAPPTPPAASAP